MVSDHSLATPFADVVNRNIGLAAQVKMCNWRHAQRPFPKQVIGLFDEIEQPFLFNKGVYTFIFYRGIYNERNHNAGKSKIWSRKFSQAMRWNIIAHELQYIYVIDVRLLRHIVDRPEFMRKGASFYVPEEKPTRNEVLYLNRTFMKGFVEMKESHRNLLDTSLGLGKWAVKKATPKFCFTGGITDPFECNIPVHVIGSKRTVKDVIRVMTKPIDPINLGYQNSSIFGNTPPH